MIALNLVLCTLVASSSASQHPRRFARRAEFTLSNGQQAQAENAKFASLTKNSSCTGNEVACVGDAFAQCVSGAFVITPCGAGTVCKSLPLVNKAGTSVTCTTEADAQARIAATGAKGGVTGSGSSSSSSSSSSLAASSSTANKCKRSTLKKQKTCSSNSTSSTSTSSAQTSSAADTSNFKKSNGIQAQKLNAEFATLSASSPCQDGEVLCTSDGSFGQCVNGKIVATTCSGGLKCFALPLVNSPGTSVTCDTEEDAAARIAASGATGGITG